MQEIRRFKPSTVCRRFSAAAAFYRTCVVDGILEHSPAEHVRCPSVPAESLTLGFTYLQSEALLTAAPESANPWRAPESLALCRRGSEPDGDPSAVRTMRSR
jgi:integrase/recombinase XerD